MAHDTAPAVAPATVPPALGEPSVGRWEAEGDAARYVGILQQRLVEGTARAGNVIEGIFSAIPEDQIAPASRVQWRAEDGGFIVGVGDKQLRPTAYALGQIAERAGVPGPYLQSLVNAPAEEQWRRQLAADILSRHYGHTAGRMLVRSVRGQLRGWLSDKYRRLDSRPLVEALVHEAGQLGAVPFDGSATDTRHALKVIIPQVIEPLPGEFMVLGAEWSNSDYGNGVNGIRAFALRVVCLNGMTRENLMKQIHLGGRLSDDVELSAKTHALDTRTSVSALRDVVRLALGPGRVERITEQLQAAAARAMSAAVLRGRAEKMVPKAVVKSIVDAYESEDVINLPPGANAWRASNAVSWIARHTEDEERRLDLERLAGSLV